MLFVFYADKNISLSLSDSKITESYFLIIPLERFQEFISGNSTQVLASY